MAKVSKIGRSFWATAVLAAIVGLCTGCADGLHKVMSSYDFTAISPPQTNWENGSVVEIDSSYPDAPVLRATPSMAQATIMNVSHDAPAVSTNYSEKLDLSLGISLPDGIKAQLTAQGAAQYSVVADGNTIVSVPIDSYVMDTFPKIADKYGAAWTLPLAQKDLYYFFEVWTCQKLTYKFFTSAGATAQITVPIKIPTNVSGDWTVGSDGSLTFQGPGTICLGYRARPIRQADSGEIVPQATGKLTAAGKAATVKLDK